MDKQYQIAPKNILQTLKTGNGQQIIIFESPWYCAPR